MYCGEGSLYSVQGYFIFFLLGTDVPEMEISKSTVAFLPTVVVCPQPSSPRFSPLLLLRPLHAAPSMPLFSSASGVHINDSNFYDIAGDMNVHSAPPMVGQGSSTSAALPLGWELTPERLFVGPERNGRPAGAATRRMVPYDISHRPQIQHLNSSDIPDDHPSSASTSTALIPVPSSFSQSFHPFDPCSSRSPSDYSRLANRTAFEYPAGDFESALALPNAVPSRYPFSAQPQPGFEMFFHLPAMIGDTSHTRNALNCPDFYPGPTNRAITYPSAHSEPHLNSAGEPGHPFPGDVREPARDSNVALTNRPDYLWDRPQDRSRTSIQGSTFIGGNVNIQRHGEIGLHILHRTSAGDAFHDSAERYPQPRCHPETRTQILEDLWTWSSGNNPSSTVLWLYGPAGAGKSAIAQSLCQKLESEGRLGGSFFFKRGHPSRGNAKKLFPTIAYQLALLKNLPDLTGAISQRVEDDPSILDRSLSTQLQDLILEPCQRGLGGRILVIIIDGLDECQGQDVQQEILRSIGNAIHKPHLSLRLLIASRPEPHIGEMFGAHPLKRCHRPVNIEQSFKDIQKYLQKEFQRIHREHHETMAGVSSPWPSKEVVKHLVKKSSGYFVHASTVIRFIDDKNFRPTDRLRIIIGLAKPDFGSPFAALDRLYTQILLDVPAQSRVLKILAVISAKFVKFNLSISYIEQLLEWKPGDVRLALRGLSSVIKIPEDNTDGLTVHHASFLDFLQDPIRAGTFYIGASHHRADLARHILKAYSDKYKDLYEYEVSSLNCSSPVACLFNDNALKYLASAEPSPDLVSLLHSLNPEFLFSHLRELSEVANTLLGWLKEIHPCPRGLIEDWEDYRFMILCASAWDQATLQPWEYHNYGEILSQVPPQLFRTLQSYRLVEPYRKGRHPLFHFHLLFNLSWDELRKVICPLRKIIGEDERGLRELFQATSDPILFQQMHSSSIF
ncbi:hypothetical protein C8F04DRAFT_1233840 [Mycena alexandri]|uniref:NACHT domain-containing protein n=1 Tax=Mycena alexandri TaxID=1745969 RepID=A0AAD6SW85_9AGAR|nr:hypothetical protein C8F04DRAFT_1233840 [Mycena alexandri]